MDGYDMYPATISNQISEEYYLALIGQINKGTCSKQVSKILRYDGSHSYFTYHLISVK